MRTIRVKLSDIRKALARAERHSDDWQAALCEILRIPAIAKRWQQINRRFPAVSINFHPGKPHKGMSREDRLQVSDWSAYAGYTLSYGLEGYCWNSVKTEWYGHSAGCAWDGVRRETVSQFVHDLYMLALGYTHAEYFAHLSAVKIEVVGDLSAVAA